MRHPDPNRPMNGSIQGGVCPGGFGRTPPETIGDSRTEFNIILCTCKSEAAVTSNKNSSIGMLKLTTDKHEASRGLSATAEFLVLAVNLHIHQSTKFLFLPRLI